MRAFKVRLNGKKLCTAGVDDDGVLSAIVDCVTRPGGVETSVFVGGLHSSTGEHLRWVHRRRLHPGDEIRIEVVEADFADTPKSKHKTHPAETLRAKKRYVREMAKELGWVIQTKKSTAS